MRSNPEGLLAEKPAALNMEIRVEARALILHLRPNSRATRSTSSQPRGYVFAIKVGVDSPEEASLNKRFENEFLSISWVLDNTDGRFQLKQITKPWQRAENTQLHLNNLEQHKIQNFCEKAFELICKRFESIDVSTLNSLPSLGRTVQMTYTLFTDLARFCRFDDSEIRELLLRADSGVVDSLMSAIVNFPNSVTPAEHRGGFLNPHIKRKLAQSVMQHSNAKAGDSIMLSEHEVANKLLENTGLYRSSEFADWLDTIEKAEMTFDTFMFALHPQESHPIRTAANAIVENTQTFQNFINFVKKQYDISANGQGAYSFFNLVSFRIYNLMAKAIQFLKANPNHDKDSLFFSEFWRQAHEVLSVSSSSSSVTLPPTDLTLRAGIKLLKELHETYSEDFETITNFIANFLELEYNPTYQFGQLPIDNQREQLQEQLTQSLIASNQTRYDQLKKKIQQEQSNGTIDPNYQLKQPPSDYECPITQAIFDEPVKYIAPDGRHEFFFEQLALKISVNSNPLNPMTRQPLEGGTLSRADAMKQEINQFLEDEEQRFYAELERPAKRRRLDRSESEEDHKSNHSSAALFELGLLSSARHDKADDSEPDFLPRLGF